MKKAEKLNVNIENLPAIKNRPHLHISYGKYFFFGVISAISFAGLYHYNLFDSQACLISMPNSLSHAFRPPEKCDFCRNVTQVPRLASISPIEFEEYFAYNGKPVIITDATTNWTAMNVFDFWYFKDVYETIDDEDERMNCQFFPVSNFHSLNSTYLNA